MNDASDEELLSYFETALTELVKGPCEPPPSTDRPRAPQSERPVGAGVYSYVDNRSLPRSLRRDTF